MIFARERYGRAWTIIKHLSWGQGFCPAAGFPAGVAHLETGAESVGKGRNREPENAEQKLGGRAEALDPQWNRQIRRRFPESVDAALYRLTDIYFSLN
jgi:hypothetical protein